ncbi:MAG: 2-nitropropane dioxygenase, partial [Parashewanella sp.]
MSMQPEDSQLGRSHIKNNKLNPWPWLINADDINYQADELKQVLQDLSQACYLVNHPTKGLGVSQQAQVVNEQTLNNQYPVSAYAPALGTDSLGDNNFRRTHGVKYAYYAGAMANGISSEELVIALGKAGILCSFGAAGLVPTRVEQAIKRIQAELPDGPYAFNLIHSPSEPALEQGSVELYLTYNVNTVEASAFLKLTPQIVWYR